MLVMRVSASYLAKTLPRSRPCARRILYARRSMLLIFPVGWTLVMSSAYSSMASVFSSCAGRGALTRACIHAGASASARVAAKPQRDHAAVQPRTKRRKELIARSGRAWLQHDLLLIGGPHGLIEIAKRRVVLLIERKKIAFQAALEMQDAILILHIVCVDEQLRVGGLRLRNIADAPVERQVDGYVVVLFGKVVKIERMHTRGVLVYVLFPGAEDSIGQESATTGSGYPARHLEIELRDERWRRTVPFWFVRKVHINGGWNNLADFVLEKFLACGVVLVALLNSAIQRFESRVGNRELALERAIRSDFEVGFALNPRFGAFRHRRCNPGAAVFIELQAGHIAFGPGKKSEGSEGGAGIEVQILAVELDEHDVRVQIAGLH